MDKDRLTMYRRKISKSKKVLIKNLKYLQSNKDLIDNLKYIANNLEFFKNIYNLTDEDIKFLINKKNPLRDRIILFVKTIKYVSLEDFKSFFGKEFNGYHNWICNYHHVKTDKGVVNVIYKSKMSLEFINTLKKLNEEKSIYGFFYPSFRKDCLIDSNGKVLKIKKTIFLTPLCLDKLYISRDETYRKGLRVICYIDLYFGIDRHPNTPESYF